MYRYLIWILFCLTSQIGFALPIINPWEYALMGYSCRETTCHKWKNCSLKAGFLGDYVFNRKLETQPNSIPSSIPSDIYQTRLQTYQGLLTFNLCDRFEFYSGFGATQISLLTPASSFNYQFTGTLQIQATLPAILYSSNNFPFFDPNSPLSLTTNPSFCYVVGLSSILWTCKNFVLSTSGHYFYTNPSIESVTLPPTMEYNALANLGAGNFGGAVPMVASSTVYLPNTTLNYQEWQADLCLAYALCLSRNLRAIPFVAIELAGVLVNFGNAVVTTFTQIPPSVGAFSPIYTTPTAFTANLYDLSQQRLFGYTIGTSFIGRDRFAAGIEWRFVNETAFSVDLNFNF